LPVWFFANCTDEAGGAVITGPWNKLIVAGYHRIKLMSCPVKSITSGTRSMKRIDCKLAVLLNELNRGMKR